MCHPTVITVKDNLARTLSRLIEATAGSVYNKEWEYGRLTTGHGLELRRKYYICFTFHFFWKLSWLYFHI